MSDALITAVRKRSKDLASCFQIESKIAFCGNIPKLFEVMNQTFNSREWRLFIDGSKLSIKAVLLNNGNAKPPIPVAYAIGLKEEYETLSRILTLIQYRRFNFKIIADFKVIAILMGLQGGYTSYSCYLCLWNSRSDNEHFIRDTWPQRTDYTPAEFNVRAAPLVESTSIIPPPLHIKIGLIKNFIKALDKNGTAYEYLKRFFPKISTLKIKSGVFNGPQIRELLANEEFEQHLNNREKSAWKAFGNVVHGFLGNQKDPNYRNIITDMLNSYHAIGARMSLKMHFLKSHLEMFPENLGRYSDEHGEKFHQDIESIENRFNGRFEVEMLGEYCWTLLRESKFVYNRKGISRHF